MKLVAAILRLVSRWNFNAGFAFADLAEWLEQGSYERIGVTVTEITQ